MKTTQSIRSGARRKLILATAAVAAIGAFATLSPSANAQTPVGGDGRLRDASNRVGSGGFNDNSSSALPPGLLGNAIVTGEITGGKGFQGDIPYFAPGAFHGNLPGSTVDSFNASSANVSTSGVLVNNAENVHLFVGDARGVTPSANFISLGSQAGYIPAGTQDQQFTSDTRLGSQSTTPVSSVLPSAIFQTAGTSAGNGQSSYVSASSLFGVKTLQNSQQTDGTSAFTNAGTGQPLNSAIGAGDRVDLSQTQTPLQSISSNADGSASPAINSALGTGLNGLGTPPGISSFATPQGSLVSGAGNGTGQTGAAGNQGQNGGVNNGPVGSSTNNPNSSAVNGNNDNNGQNGNGVNNPNAPINAQISASIGPKSNSNLSNGYAVATAIGSTPLSGAIKTGEGTSTDFYSKTSSLPGSKYQQMLQRFKSLNPNAQLSPIQQNLLYQAKVQDKVAADQAAKQGGVLGSTPELKGGGGGGVGGGTPMPGGIGAAPATPTPSNTGAVIPDQMNGGKNKPIAINTFTGDEASAATRDLLKQAEDLMRQGKYTTALDKYDQIEQQSPSEPYIKLARANAELGASYYDLAFTHLHDAFLANPALLSAQLDLRSFLGADKVQYLVKDLKDVAQANPTAYKPVLLLSYICYNTNNPRGAAAYLDLAQKREGKPDPFYDLLRKNWDLPDISDQKPDDTLNK